MSENNSKTPNLSLNLKELKEAQNSGAPIEKVQGNRNADYSLAHYEQHLVHVQIHEPQYNPSTGVDEGRKFVQKFDAKEFDAMSKSQAFAGKKLTIFHDPSLKREAGEVVGPTPPPPVKTEATTAANGLSAEKPLDQWSKKELQAEWAKLFAGTGNTLPDTKELIVADIQERRLFLASESSK